ncbi:hypothetical protein D0V51_24475, partial [Salmonella enterica]|nr:hypothetical protein [Salmonella enterica]
MRLSQCTKKPCPTWTVSDNQNGPERGQKETENGERKAGYHPCSHPVYADARRSLKTGVWPG